MPDVRMELANGGCIQGFIDEGYEPLADAFRANFVERRDLGATCAVYVAGRQVVDLWGGLADRRSMRPWDAETAAVIFSCSKGILAVCAWGGERRLRWARSVFPIFVPFFREA